MISKINSNSYFIFDLDDTLYQEIDYLRSAYRYISEELEKITKINVYDDMWVWYEKKRNVFDWIIKTFGKSNPSITKAYLLKLYRYHMPDICLKKDVKIFLDFLSIQDIPAGIITDGRSITQRNKLKALSLENYFHDIIISEEFGSEKPDVKNFLYFMNKYPNKEFVFVADNTSKDFIVPKKFGWFTICLKDGGNNIHKQNLPHSTVDKVIRSFDELLEDEIWAI